MAIYIDPLGHYGMIIRGRTTRSCHMWTDGNPEELHEFAERIGMKRAWYQHELDKLPHYDLTEGRRYRAVALGAIELSRGEAGRLWRDLKAAGLFKKESLNEVLEDTSLEMV